MKKNRYDTAYKLAHTSFVIGFLKQSRREIDAVWYKETNKK